MFSIYTESRQICILQCQALEGWNDAEQTKNRPMNEWNEFMLTGKVNCSEPGPELDKEKSSTEKLSDKKLF